MTAPIRTLIADDEPPAREIVRTLLDRDPEVVVVGECEGGREAASALEAGGVDLVLLDVQMPELTGFDVIEQVGPAHMPVVVFVTAYDEYALRAFEAQALDYLLKPFDDERFARVLTRAKEEVRRDRQAELARRMERLLLEQRDDAVVERITMRDGDRRIPLPVAAIDWIEAADYHVRVHVGPVTHTVRDTMDRMEARLDATRFVRVHRGAIVNLERVAEIRGSPNDASIVLRDGTAIRVSRARRRVVEQRLGSR